MADGVGSRPHGGIETSRTTDTACYRILADPAGAVGRQSGRAFPATSARPRGSGALLVQLLLVSQEQVAPRKTARALWAFEWLLFGMRALMSLQVFEAGKGALARSAYVGSWLVGFGGREGSGGGGILRGGGVGFDGLDRSCTRTVLSVVDARSDCYGKLTIAAAGTAGTARAIARGSRRTHVACVGFDGHVSTIMGLVSPQAAVTGGRRPRASRRVNRRLGRETRPQEACRVGGECGAT